jgi:hypothetical protein
VWWAEGQWSSPPGPAGQRASAVTSRSRTWTRDRPVRSARLARWEAEAISHLLGTRTAALLCVHGAHVQVGGLHAQGVAIVPAHLLRNALGYDRVLSDGDVELLATTARVRLRLTA